MRALTKTYRLDFLQHRELTEATKLQADIPKDIQQQYPRDAEGNYTPPLSVARTQSHIELQSLNDPTRIETRGKAGAK
jgi:hypothetical protein